MRLFQLSMLAFTMLAYCTKGLSQDVPNLSGSAQLSPDNQAASKTGSVPVNLFTGTPEVSVPIFNYSHNGIGLNIELNYDASGTQVNQYPSLVGLNWYLNAGGSITRTVRGVPDDIAQTGFLNSAAIPADFRSSGDKYYFDSLDSQQDIFQFNINGRSGKFFIGKNGQVILIPLSKLKIQYFTDAVTKNITAFKITDENGVKYVFSDKEVAKVEVNASNTAFKSGYAGLSYATAWNISQIISTFYTDTIKFNYTTSTDTSSLTYPQVAFFRTSDNAKTSYTPSTTMSAVEKKISSIILPNKNTISFVYSNVFKSDNSYDHALYRINLSDTIFRSGFILNYTQSETSRLLLKSVTPYTAKEAGDSYLFTYRGPSFPSFTYSDQSILNKKDYWGYYNGANNVGTALPQITGIPGGANRMPNGLYATANSLSSIYLPSGGYIFYDFELNDHYPYTKSTPQLTVSSPYTSQNSMTLTDVFSNQRQINFSFPNTISRTGAPPITGSCTLNFSIVDAVQTSTVYQTYSFDLLNLYYSGIRTWNFNLPNGNYLLKSSLSGGGTATGLPVTISWENKALNTSVNYQQCGGLRIKKITKSDANDIGNVSIATEYKYTDDNGRSTGFLGDIPRYDYPFRETIINGSTTITDYTTVSSDPLNTMNYAQGGLTGYSRVTVYHGTATHNTGKEVYDYTNLQDVSATYSTSSFPYVPQDIKDWALGLPEQISLYDSSGVLKKRTVNTFTINNTSYQTSDFKSLKMGNSATTYNGPKNVTTPQTRMYYGQEYYPSSGNVLLTNTKDTLFNSDGSLTTSYQTIAYDSYYNPTLVTTSYNRSKGLQLETRFYYPYNYTIGGAIGKLRDSNVIAAKISSESWITGDANPRITDAAITDYQQITSGNIVPSALYKLQSNAPVTQATITPFTGSSLVRNATYLKQQLSYSVYDAKSNLLQTTNAISSQKQSVIMDYNSQLPIAKVSNADVANVAATSFESDGPGNWTIASAARDKSNSVTGKCSYNLSNGNVTKTNLNSTVTYVVSLWAKTGAVAACNGQSIQQYALRSNGWGLYSATVTGVTTVTISGSGLIDELRLHPKDANMVTYTYEPNVGVTSTCDANNTIAYTEYDNFNRIKLIRDKDNNIIKRYQYYDYPIGISTAPKLVPVPNKVVCEDGINGKYDSVYVDTNLYSNSYLDSIKIFKGYNYCSCSTNPVYKMIGTVCEQGLRYNTASTQHKVYNPDNTWYWVWKCTYHYQWSDGSVSADYTEDNRPSSCPLGPDNS